jgi:putative ABC transport system substrate-binding protein
MWYSTVGGIVALTLSLFAAPLVTHAQPVTKVYQIGRLSAGRPLPESHAYEEAFRQELRELGYVEGQNLVLEYRYAEGSAERLPDLAAELVQRKVDVLVVGGVPAIRAAQQATRTIPIIMAGVTDPVGQGLVTSLARPGGNITGVSLLNEELPGKRLELLKETVPQRTRIAVLVNPALPAYASRMHNLTVAARALGLHLHVVEVRRADELEGAFAAMSCARVDALIVIAEPALMDGLRGQIADLATTSRLPAMYDWKMYMEAGGLISYGPSLPAVYRRAATYVDKILKGTKPADLPVEQPMKFELVLNLKTAQALGLTIPPVVLLQADEVIQ